MCAICLRPMPIRKDGFIRVHGPHKDRCPGSGRPPRTVDGRSTIQPGLSTSEASSDDLGHGEQSDTTTTPLTIPSCPPNISVLRRIPRDSREKTSAKLTTVLDQVVGHNDRSAWERLLLFPIRCLRDPKRGRHKRSLASVVNLQVLEEKDPMVDHSGEPYRGHHSSDPLGGLARRVTIKLEEGNFKRAVRVASSEDTLAEMDEATILALRAKHPPPHPNFSLPPPPDDDSTPAVSVTEREVAAAIHFFPNESAGGDWMVFAPNICKTSLAQQLAGAEMYCFRLSPLLPTSS